MTFDLAEEAEMVAEATFGFLIPVMTARDSTLATRFLADLFPEAKIGHDYFLNVLQGSSPEVLRALSSVVGSRLLKIKCAQVPPPPSLLLGADWLASISLFRIRSVAPQSVALIDRSAGLHVCAML